MAWWDAVRGYWRRRRGPAGRSAAGLRVTGEPPSPNGASSMHLWWELPYGEGLTAVRATLEILDPPVTNRLYFWALQVAFVKPDGGGAHLGLQHNRRHPRMRAANFGGYAPQDIGGLLDGLDSELPSADDNPNTRDFHWDPETAYRLSIERVDGLAPPGLYAWKGSIEEVESGRSQVVRVLLSRGEYMRGPVVWTESFGRCDHPSVAARWSNLEAVGEDGRVIPITVGSVNYQQHSAGGCDNSDMTFDGVGWVQRTGIERKASAGTRLSVR